MLYQLLVRYCDSKTDHYMYYTCIMRKIFKNKQILLQLIHKMMADKAYKKLQASQGEVHRSETKKARKMPENKLQAKKEDGIKTLSKEKETKK